MNHQMYALYRIAFAVVILLPGCAGDMPTAPNGGVLSQADCGPPPSDVSGVIAEYLRPMLKDPNSAQVERVTGPSRVATRSGILGPGTYGWGICFQLNAKNSHGGYVGFRQYALIYRDGRVLQGFGHEANPIDGAMTRALCEKIS